VPVLRVVGCGHAADPVGHVCEAYDMGEHVVARASAALGGVSAMAVTAAVRSYLSSQHLWSARHFTRLAADYERDHADDSRISVQHRAYVLSAVGEAVAFLEAFINELYQDAADGTAGAADGLSPGMVRLMAEHWRGTNSGKSISAVEKYDMARVYAGQLRSDAGRRPHQDVKALIDLRNWSVHYRPRTNSDANPDGLTRHLQGRFADNPLLPVGGGPWFPSYALGSGCAEWAVRSARAFADEFVAVVGCQANYQHITFDEQP
jgi:hypothetical protein